MIRLIAFVVALLTAVPALAMPKPAEISVLPGWRTETGTHMVGLRVQLKPGWKTYWRSPGDAGIPPVFDLAGSDNISGFQIHWPVPQVFDAGGMRIVAYKGDVILPIELTLANADAPARLELKVDLGVCEHVCMPMTVHASVELPSPGTRPGHLVAALIDQPAHHRATLECDIAPTADGFAVTITAPFGGPAAAVIETGNPLDWVSEPQVSHGGGMLTARAEIVAAAPVLDRSALRLTLLGAEGAEDHLGCR